MRKICPRCKEEKEIEEFPIVNKNTGKTIYCHPCKKEYDKEWWKKSGHKRVKIKTSQAKVIRQRNRLYIVGILKNAKCMDCGNGDWRVLEFDHRITSEKEFNIADALTYSVIKIQREVDKCDIVCANCHNIRTIVQRGYYKNIA